MDIAEGDVAEGDIAEGDIAEGDRVMLRLGNIRDSLSPGLPGPFYVMQRRGPDVKRQ